MSRPESSCYWSIAAKGSEERVGSLMPEANTTGKVTSKQLHTGIFVPYNCDSPQLGCHAVYIGQDKFYETIKEVIGIDHSLSAPSVDRDFSLLNALDKLPSLDPFLLNQSIVKMDDDITEDMFNISAEEVARVRSVIEKKMMPILTKAFSGAVNGTAGRVDVSRFVASLWEPSSPDAQMFVKAFGITGQNANEVFDALKGIAYYEACFEKTSKVVRNCIGWLQSSDGYPYDLRVFPHDTERHLMFRSSISDLIQKTRKTAVDIFNQHQTAHREFLDKSDPRPYRKFLEAAVSQFSALGRVSAGLSNIEFLFEPLQVRAATGRLSLEETNKALSQMQLILASSFDSNVTSLH